MPDPIDPDNATPQAKPDTPSPRPPVDPRGAAAPPPPPPGYMPPMYGPPPGRGSGWVGRLITSTAVTLLLASVGLNLYLGVLVAALTGGPNETVYMDGDASQRIVVLPIEGLIDDRTAQFVHMALKALRDHPPKAVVLRVDSGGGYVAPSDRIWHELERFRGEMRIPIIASFGSTAASGGYYVAASSDVIVAEPTTITGSIGVIAQAFTVGELLDKIGVTPEVIPSTDSTRKDMLNPMRAWTDADRDKLRNVLDSAYERFVKVVHQGRSKTTSLTLDEVRAVATGEVFTADEAIASRLVDQEGYLPDAIDAAKSKAGIAAATQPQVTVIGPPRTFGLSALLGKTQSPRVSDLSVDQLRTWAMEAGTPRLMFQLGGQ